MPTLNQKVSAFLKEQQSFIDDECIEVLMILHERGNKNMSYLKQNTEIKHHRMPIVIRIIEAFGFAEKNESSNFEYRLTNFGRDYLVLRGLVKKEKEKKEELYFSLNLPVAEVGDVDIDILTRMLRLIYLGTYTSINELSTQIKVDETIIKNILENLALAKFAVGGYKEGEKEKIKCYSLLPPGEEFYLFIRKRKSATAFKLYLKEEFPVLLDTLKEVAEKGDSAHQTELTYLQTLGLIYFKRKRWDVTTLGKVLV